MQHNKVSNIACEVLKAKEKEFTSDEIIVIAKYMPIFSTKYCSKFIYVFKKCGKQRFLRTSSESYNTCDLQINFQSRTQSPRSWSRNEGLWHNPSVFPTNPGDPVLLRMCKVF